MTPAQEWKALSDSIPIERRILSPWWLNLDDAGQKRAAELAPELAGLFK